MILAAAHGNSEPVPDTPLTREYRCQSLRCSVSSRDRHAPHQRPTTQFRPSSVRGVASRATVMTRDRKVGQANRGDEETRRFTSVQRVHTCASCSEGGSFGGMTGEKSPGTKVVASTRLGCLATEGAAGGWVATAQSTHVPNSRCEVPCPLGRKSGRPAYPVHCGSIVEGGKVH